MLTKTKTIVTALLLFITVISAVAQEKYEYGTVTYTFGNKKIRISAAGEFEARTGEGSKDVYDFNPVLKVLNEMQDKGWEVYQSTAGVVENVIYFIRKKKN